MTSVMGVKNPLSRYQTLTTNLRARVTAAMLVHQDSRVDLVVHPRLCLPFPLPWGMRERCHGHPAAGKFLGRSILQTAVWPIGVVLPFVVGGD